MLMMKNGFLCESAQHRGTRSGLCRCADPPGSAQDNAKVDMVMSNSFGFGGTNATLVFQRYNG